jgi:hypothetical protein
MKLLALLMGSVKIIVTWNVPLCTLVHMYQHIWTDHVRNEEVLLRMRGISYMK